MAAQWPFSSASLRFSCDSLLPFSGLVSHVQSAVSFLTPLFCPLVAVSRGIGLYLRTHNGVSVVSPETLLTHFRLVCSCGPVRARNVLQAWDIDLLQKTMPNTIFYFCVSALWLNPHRLNPHRATPDFKWSLGRGRVEF